MIPFTAHEDDTVLGCHRLGCRTYLHASSSSSSNQWSYAHEPDNNSSSSSQKQQQSQSTSVVMIRKMIRFFSSMVDDSSCRFYYLCRRRHHHSVETTTVAADSTIVTEEEVQNQYERSHHHVPIRDLAAAWDSTKAVRFLMDDDDGTKNNDHHHIEHLLNAIHATLVSYHQFNIDNNDQIQNIATSCGGGSDRGGFDFIDGTFLSGETPNIGHSAMWILAATGIWRIDNDNHKNENNVPTTATTNSHHLLDPTITATAISCLVNGILKQQRSDNGAFQINFIDTTPSHPLRGEENVDGGNNNNNNNTYQGIEFFPGEAMLALMEVHESSSRQSSHLVDEETCHAILAAMKHSFDFYSTYYFDHQQDVDTNYNIWQIQCFARLVWALKNSDGDDDDGEDPYLVPVSNYVVQLCQGIITSPAWRELNRGKSFYPNLKTLEIVCGLDALVDGIRVISDIADSRDIADIAANSMLSLHVNNAVDFLLWTQDQSTNGGLGYGGTHVIEQRLDVTGHAISALTKLRVDIEST
jgi:hypothetical protein